jgi:hypothetical protein
VLCILLGVSGLAAAVAFAFSKPWFQEFETFLGSRIGDTEDKVSERVPPWHCGKLPGAEDVAELRWCVGSGTSPKRLLRLPARYIFVKVQAIFYRGRLLSITEDFSCTSDSNLRTTCQEFFATYDFELALTLLRRWGPQSGTSDTPFEGIYWVNLRGHALLFQSWLDWPANDKEQVQHILLGLVDTRWFYRLLARDRHSGRTYSEDLDSLDGGW